jgi:ribosomal protein S1
MELKGTVKRVELAGAVIDVGAEVDALLHISQIRPGRIKNVGDYLQEGEAVTVWVRQVDAEHGQIAVTLIKPPAVTWNELAPGQVYQGKVVRIEKFGVFVDIGAERPGLVHVSELATGYVSSPGDVVEKGQEVEVKVIKLDRRKNQIDLSIKQLATAPPAAAPSDGEPEQVPTAMALALQKALNQGGSGIAQNSAKRASRNRNQKQEEILDRTLQRLENK